MSLYLPFMWENKKMLPFDVKFIADTLIVYPVIYNSLGGFKIGDRILSIGEESVEELIDKNRKQIATSNEETYLRDLKYILRLFDGDSINISFERSGIIKDTIVKYRTHYDRNPQKKLFMMLEDSIGLLNPGAFNEREEYNKIDYEALKKEIFSSKGLIIDNRCYPLLFSGERRLSVVADFFIPEKVHNATNILSSLEIPGLFTSKNEYTGTLNPNSYTAPIVVIVNSETQSMAEYTTMIFQQLSNVTTIGSQTAGTDGNVTLLYFPESFSIYFTAMGVYYPDGGETQRIGLRIDEKVYPTVQGICQGRDELLERAVEIIKLKNND